MTVIDAHLHIWDLQRSTYAWLGPQLAPIDRTFTFSEARDVLSDAGVGAAILVQAADDPADTETMLAAADRHSEVAGVVAWAPLDDADAMPGRAEELAADRRVVGVRALIHEQDDPRWVLRPDVSRGLTELARVGLPFDYVTSGPEALAHIPELVEAHPALRIVIDHLGKPDLAADREGFVRWRDSIERAAYSPNVFCKLSGFRWRADGTADTDQARQYVAAALQAFGSSRLMYGGDWPVSLLSDSGYGRTLTCVSTIIGELDPDSLDAVLAGTAATFYALDPPRQEN
jgi:L-fuconolactonase